MFIQQLFEGEIKRVIVIYPGRFQPFHLGHKEVFETLQAKFGMDNVFIGTSNKTDAVKSPFNFSDKLQLMTAAGVNNHHVIEVTSPYMPDDYIRTIGFDPKQTVMIFAVGEPDLKRLEVDANYTALTPTGRPSKIPDGKSVGDPKPFKTFQSLQDSTTADQHQYVLIVNEREKAVEVNGKKINASHGTQVRELWNQVRNDPKASAQVLQQLYGRATPELAHLFNKIPDSNAAPAPAPAAAPKLKVVKQPQPAADLNEFAPPGGDDGNDGFSDETLKRLAAQWWQGDEDPRVEQTLAAAGWEIGQDEGYDNGGVFVVRAGDINGNSYISWPAEELEGLGEGAIITKDQLVDIYIKGKGKNNMPIQKKVGAQIPNSKVNAFISAVADKYGLNPKAFVYGPSNTMSEDAAGVGVVASKKQKNDPRYSMSLTKDVRPGEVARNMKKLHLEGNRGYNHGFASPTAPSLGRRGREDDEYHVPDPTPSTWYIRADGKIIKDKMGTPFQFRDKEAARKSAMTMMAKPFNAGKKFVLTTQPSDEAPVAEASDPVTHRIGLTVTDPNHPMVSKRKETYQKSVRVTGPDREAAINQAIAHARRKGYKVHDHHYMGIVDNEPMNELSPKTLGSYAKKAAIDAKFLGHQAGAQQGDAMAHAKRPGDGADAGSDIDDRAHKRLKGVNRAVDKLTGIDEGENKGLYYNVNKRKAAGTSRPAGHPKAPTPQAWKDAAKTAKEDVAETVLNPKDPQGDYDAKRKVIHDLSLDPNVDQQAVQQRRLDLDREAKSKGLKEQGVAETTGDKPFDNMIKTIKQGTNKQKTADRKEQQKQTQQRARDAFGNMFGGGNPADKLSIRKGMAEGTEQVYKILAVSKSNALGKKVKLNVKASSLDEVFERLAASDWYPLDINGVEVINGKRLKQGMAEGLDEAVGGNYLYHATGADGLKGMLSSGSIRSASSPQKATAAQTRLPTVSMTRDWGYASGAQAQTQMAGIGRDAILVLDRNAIESNFKTLGTSQSTNIKGLSLNPYLKKDGEARSQNTDAMARANAKGKAKYAEPTAKAGGEFEEAVVVPKGALPLRGTMIGFWVNPKSELMKDPSIMNDPRRLDMVRPNQFVKATQQQGVAEGKKPDNYHIVNKDGKPASLASYADQASAVKDRDAKHPGAEVRQVSPRGKVKGVAESMFGIDDKIKGQIQNITTEISDIPGYWDHQRDTFTPYGVEALEKALGNNKKYVKYALSLTSDDYYVDENSLGLDHKRNRFKSLNMRENAEELNIGDPVIISGQGIEFEGKTGDIDSFGDMKRFVVVNLYNHGRHSFHSSDVSYNDYADREDDLDEDLYQYDKEDPYNSEFAPRAGMGRMTLRGWKQQMIRRTAELAQQMSNAGQDIDKSALWDHVHAKLKSMNMDPIAQEIEQAQAELEKIRQRGGVRSRAFNK